MKRILYILAVMAAMGAWSCQKTIEPEKITTDTPIELGVSGIDVAKIQNSPASRAIGGIMENLTDFGTEKIAVFGIKELFADGTQLWEVADRLFSTTQATIEIDPSTNVGKIDYYESNPDKKVYYPQGGYLNVYALYPASSYLTIVEATAGTNKPVGALVTLAKEFKDQYDVLHGAHEKLTVAQAQRADISFSHALSQLRFKIYKEDNTISGRVSSITVSGVSKASLTDIRKADFTFSTDVSDSLDFVVYNGSAQEITALNKESAVDIGGSLMLFPGKESVRCIKVTVDGQTYLTLVPQDWNLNQGKINTITLRINKFGVRTESQWTVSEWGKGQGVDQDLENNGKFIRVSAPLVNGDKSGYTGSMIPVSADITIDGYTHKGIQLEYNTTDKKFTTQWFNSGSLNNEPLYLTDLTLYDNNTKPIFQGMTKGGVLSTNARIEIDTLNTGSLKVNGVTLNLNMDFGGFGEGSQAIPYEVSTALHLDNVRNFLGRAAGNLTGTPNQGAYFVQINDIDLGAHLAIRHDGTSFGENTSRTEPFIGSSKGWTPIGTSTTPFYSSYDGQGYKISGVYINLNTTDYVGLFCSVGVVTQSQKNNISRLTIGSGYIAGQSYIGAIAGTAAVNITACHNYADLKGFKRTGANNIGGLIGSLSTVTGIISKSSNHGNVFSDHTHAAGLVGSMAASTRIDESFNTGNVSANDYVGGLVSSCPGGVVTNSYNRGAVNAMSTAADVVIGGLIASINRNTTVQNSYNRAIVSNSANKNYTGGVIGFVSVALSANYTNNHFLVQPPLTGIGSVAGGVGANTNSTPQSEADLRALAPTLGASWTEDNLTTPINEGYPILVWQK